MKHRATCICEPCLSEAAELVYREHEAVDEARLVPVPRMLPSERLALFGKSVGVLVLVGVGVGWPIVMWAHGAYPLAVASILLYLVFGGMWLHGWLQSRERAA